VVHLKIKNMFPLGFSALGSLHCFLSMEIVHVFKKKVQWKLVMPHIARACGVQSSIALDIALLGFVWSANLGKCYSKVEYHIRRGLRALGDREFPMPSKHY